MCFLDFTVDTYEIQIHGRGDDGMDEEEPVTSIFGRKKNARSCYLEGHPRYHTHERIRRSKNHNYMPNIIGPWFPRRDVEKDEAFYFASILACLRPWRSLGELIGDSQTWKEEGLHFIATASTGVRDVIAGMQYYYDSKSAAQHYNEEIMKM
jgi:hypothetical protein